MPGFQRVNPIGEGLIRGPARILVAPVTNAFPVNLAGIVNVKATDAAYHAEVQTVAVTGTPTAGTFVLSFEGVQTAPIAYNASSAAVAAALNALSAISSQGGVTVTGGPLPAAVTVTFGVMGNQPLIAAPSSLQSFTGGTTPGVTVAETTSGNGQWDTTPGTGWVDLGSTRSGVQATMNNTEDQLDIDQVLGSILGVPNEWEMTIATQLAETTLENIQLAWEGSAITVDNTTSPSERHLGMGNPLAYTSRKLAVLHQKTIGPAAGRVRALVYRNVTRSPQNSSLDYQKAGQMQTLAQTWRAYADATISDPLQRFGQIIEQQSA